MEEAAPSNIEEWGALLITWQALKMTFAVLPGICIVVWAGHAGWSGNRARLRTLHDMWAEIRMAKREGLMETARMFAPAYPVLAYVCLLVILFLVPTDAVLLLVVNFCALPAAVVCYREGRRAGAYRGGSADPRHFDLPWPALIKVMGLWLITAGGVLCALWALNVWRPA